MGNCNECGTNDAVQALLTALRGAERAVTKRDGVLDPETFDSIWTEHTYQAWLNYKANVQADGEVT